MIDSRRVLDLWRRLVETESGSRDGRGIDAVGQIVAEALVSAGCTVEPAGRARSGANHLRALRPGSGRPVLLLGHLDTVWPRGTLARNPFRINDGRGYGPGVADMKGGLAVLAEAVRATADLPERPALAIGLTADEELGSPTGRRLVEALAADATACLTFESGRPDGSLVDRRGAVGVLEMRITGRTAHAAHDPEIGANAVDELAFQLLRLRGLREPPNGISAMAGIVRGGTARQVVPEHAEALIDLRAPSTARMEALVADIRAVRPQVQGTQIEISGGMTRPAMEPGPPTEALRARIRRAAEALGQTVRFAATGGGSDASFAAAMGVPTLDGFGPIGNRICSLEEFADVESAAGRAALVAELLRSLSAPKTEDGRSLP
jgi:glutamate carboxypeptidase